MKTTVTALFDRRKRLALDNTTDKSTVEIYIYQSQPNLRKYITTNISIEQQFWDNKKRIVSSKHPNAPHLNKIIRDTIQTIEDFTYGLYANKKVLTTELLHQLLTSKKTSTESFTQFFEREINPALKRGTRKEHEYTLNVLKEFRSDILFTEINYSLVQEFDRFMRFNKNFMQNTIHKHHAHIKRFLRLAALNELYDPIKSPYNTFTSKKERSERINLSAEELQAIEAIDTAAYPELMLVKNMFLFSCYTGLRFSDIITLEQKHLVSTREGLTIVKKMEKVPKPITLPLLLLFNGKPYNILLNYLSNNEGFVFPPITNQQANRSLKVIAVIAKISMRLTFHIARHTFGTTLAEATQNPYLIMDLMGHADIKTSMIYIHRSQERINKQLRGVKW